VVAELIVAEGVQSGSLPSNTPVNPFVSVVYAWNVFCTVEGSFSTKMQGTRQFYAMNETVAQKWIDFFIRKLDETTTMVPELAVQPLWFVMSLFDYQGGAEPWLDGRITERVALEGRENGMPVIGRVEDAIQLWWKIVVEPVRDGVEWDSLYTIDEEGHINGVAQPVVRILPEWL